MQLEPIAIVGIGCRFPGHVTNVNEYWKLLCDGVDAITDVPRDRWDLRRHYDPDPSKPGKMYTSQAGFLGRKIDQFDAAFFGISPREAARLDPQQRLLLEVSWEALEDAGIPVESVAGSRTGVYVGLFTSDSGALQGSRDNRALVDAHSASGVSVSPAAGRISYTFDFRGPCMSLDTACSSSLVAVHYACQSLLSGETDMALAGGVNMIFHPIVGIMLSKAGMVSPDCRCKAFDAGANGYVRGEGGGMVLLKRLSSALADGNQIYAVIRGTAVNQDGATDGLTVPNGSAQETLVREACCRAGVAPADITYVEAHGTGTPVGDPIEAVALGTVLSEGRPPEDRCIMGSVKTNIGHLEAGAGVAGLIKAALCLQHGQIPPHLHLHEPNPNIPFDALQLRLPTTLEPLPRRNGTAFVGVNSFGFSGTNAHAVLEEAPPSPAVHPAPDGSSDRTLVLPLSTRNESALRDLAATALESLTADADHQPRFADICYSASLRRSQHAQRLALVARSIPEVAERLRSFLAGEIQPGIVTGHVRAGAVPRTIFVFTGMGPQWWAMGRELLATEPVFRETIEHCDALFRQYTDWSLLAEMNAGESESRVAETQIAQMMNFALQAGLFHLWRSWGIVPDAVLGHSVGEVSAAYAAGALSMEDAARVSFHRGRLQGRAAGQGAMLAAGLPVEEIQTLLGDREHLVSVAAVNSRQAVTLSGDRDTLTAIAAELEAREAFNRFLQVDVAYHSPQMDPLHDELFASLEGLQPLVPTTPLYSTVTGEAVDTAALDARYWWRNVREPVQFAAAIEHLIGDAPAVFLEIGPHPVLSTSIADCLAARGQSAAIVPSISRKAPEQQTIMTSLASLYTLGLPINWNAFYPAGGRFTRLPAYPWQRESHWIESRESADERLGNDRHPFLDRVLRSPHPAWEAELNGVAFPYIRDHKVEGTTVFPGAGYVETGLAIAQELMGDTPCTLEEIDFRKMLVLPPGPDPILHVSFDPERDAYAMYSRRQSEDATWSLHATGKLWKNVKSIPGERVALDRVRARCTEVVEPTQAYRDFDNRGLNYGPAFQGIACLWRGDGEVLGEIRIQEVPDRSRARYRLHPAVLDSVIQTLITLMEPGVLYVPTGIKRVRFHATPGPVSWCHCRITRTSSTAVEADLRICDDAGRVLVSLEGFRAQALNAGHTTASPLDRLLYQGNWMAQARRDGTGGRSDGAAVLAVPDATRDPFQLLASALGTLRAPNTDLNGGRSHSQAKPREGFWLLVDGHTRGGEKLAALLEQRGESVILVSPGDSYRRLGPHQFEASLEEPEGLAEVLATVRSENPSCRAVVYLAGGTELSPPNREATLEDLGLRDCTSALHLMQAVTALDWSIPPRAWFITRGAHQLSPDDAPAAVDQVPLWGMGRTCSREYPELSCSLIDVPAADLEVELNAICTELLADEPDREIALRGGTRFVHRLERVTTEDLSRHPVQTDVVPVQLQQRASGTPEALEFREVPRHALKADEVEIKVRSASVRQRDVVTAHGSVTSQIGSDTFLGSTLGSDCTGAITAIGESVTTLQVGDEVVAFGPACLSSYVSLPARFVLRKPAHIADSAATGLTAAATAYHCLHNLARLRRNDRVLVHGASDEFGLSAIEYAQSAGALVYATADTPEGREYLRTRGVRYVTAAHSPAFADDLMRWTQGQGMDVVLNSLPADLLAQNLSILAPGGRCIQVGHLASTENMVLDVSALANNRSYTTFDLDRWAAERPEDVEILLSEVVESSASGWNVPTTVYPASEVAAAFRRRANPKHIGGIAISFEHQTVSAAPLTVAGPIFSPDATYLITGGLGGLGLETAQWMVAGGARTLVLVGRRGATAPEAQSALALMRAAGARVEVLQADISDRSQVDALLDQIDRTLPPLRGIMHMALVLDDAYLIHQSAERLRRVMNAKVLGAWHLHHATVGTELDFFLLYSSFIAELGNPGQVNYAAACAFLDGLAQQRRASGLPAMSIDWGAIGDVGVVARDELVADSLSAQGIQQIPVKESIAILEQLLRANPVQASVVDVDWQKLARVDLAIATSTVVQKLVGELPLNANGSEHDGGGGLRAELLEMSPENRQTSLMKHLAESVAGVIGASADRIDLQISLNDLGMDSLMGAQLRTEIERDTGALISMTRLLQGPSVADLAAYLLPQLTEAVPA